MDRTFVAPLEPEAVRKSRLWPLLTFGGVVVSIILGLTIGGVLATQDKRNAASFVTPSPSSPAPSRTQTYTAPRAVIVMAPNTLVGTPKIADRDMQKAATATANSMAAAVPTVSKTITGIYGTSAKDVIMVVAASGDITSPYDVLAALEKAISAQLTGTRTVEPGPLGGSARCGDIVTRNTRMAVCMWADQHTFGYFYFVGKRAIAVDDLFVRARAQVEIVR